MKLSKQSAKPSFPELRGSIDHITYPAWGEIKYDGELAYVIYAGDKICTVNKYGTVREDFPALEEIHSALKSANTTAGIFLGELYFGEGKLHCLYGLNSNKESDSLSLKLFDTVQVDEVQMTDEDLLTRKEILHDCLGNLVIDGSMLKDKTAVDIFFEDIKNAGYEGIVVKNLASKLTIGPCDWAKMKGKDRTDYGVSLIDSNRERIEVRVPIPGSNSTTTFTGQQYVTVGCKAPNKYKKHIKIGNTVTIEHQGVLPSGKLRHPVLIPKPEWK